MHYFSSICAIYATYIYTTYSRIPRCSAATVLVCRSLQLHMYTCAYRHMQAYQSISLPLSSHTRKHTHTNTQVQLSSGEGAEIQILRSDLIKASNLGGVRGGESSLSRYRPDTGKSKENSGGAFQIFWRKAREKGRYVCVWVLMEGECLYVNICIHAQTYSQTYRHKKSYKRAL